MSPGTALQLPHLPDFLIYALLFKDVKNAAHLRQQLVAGNTEFEYAFLDATKILSVNHALAAVFRAVNDMIHNRLKSRNVHSEIVFSLNPNNNIADSFRRFGVTDSTKHVLAVKVVAKQAQGVQPVDPETHLKAVVEGTHVDFNDENLKDIADLPQIRKLYKLDAPLPSKAGKNKPKKAADNEASDSAQTNGINIEIDNVRDMEAVILGIMALKGS
ncbi:uncharacterized protein PV09_00416 [Verruconis gallopava]|uniref:EKC/KEOPS complex subunit CGI121 n=1 Tax=Verruconis gallopava TaxID=253628 RepID=A0A0D2AS84_9PEZI|nr:uncharacterized protein PV09_00416 [Verruconis gallopava]KIW09543.1 hypothetical protein PV09_00416 [Verruconis gallopava]